MKIGMPMTTPETKSTGNPTMEQKLLMSTMPTVAFSTFGMKKNVDEDGTVVEKFYEYRYHENSAVKEQIEWESC